MPLHDFLCDPDMGGCGNVEENWAMKFAEFDDFKAAGCPCPECGHEMRQVFSTCRFHFPSVNTGKGIKPTSKRGQMQQMEQRYKKRNERLEKLPPDQKARMEKFFERRGVRKTPPSSSEHA